MKSRIKNIMCVVLAAALLAGCGGVRPTTDKMGKNEEKSGWAEDAQASAGQAEAEAASAGQAGAEAASAGHAGAEAASAGHTETEAAQDVTETAGEFVWPLEEEKGMTRVDLNGFCCLLPESWQFSKEEEGIRTYENLGDIWTYASLAVYELSDLKALIQDKQEASGEEPSTEANAGGENVNEANAGGENVNEANAGGKNVNEANAGGENVNEANAGGENVNEANAGGENVNEANAGGENVNEANAAGESTAEANTPAGEADNEKQKAAREYLLNVLYGGDGVMEKRIVEEAFDFTINGLEAYRFYTSYGGEVAYSGDVTFLFDGDRCFVLNLYQAKGYSELDLFPVWEKVLFSARVSEE